MANLPRGGSLRSVVVAVFAATADAATAYSDQQ